MFSHTISTFGPHEKHTFQNARLGTKLSIVPACGGFLSELQMPYKESKINCIDGNATFEEWKADGFYKSAWLLPFPNRLKGGKYEFEGKEYAFPINDLSCQNALHGFVFDQVMNLQKVELFDSYAEFHLEYIYEGELAHYPFPFRLQMNYRLEEQRLVCEAKIRNTEKGNIPIGLGFHPYFQFPTAKVDELYLQLPQCEQIEVDERMIPTGKQIPFADFKSPSKIEGKTFDTCFKATASESSTSSTYEIQLKDLQNQLQLTYFQDAAFPYFQIFTPSHRKSIAIEPMTCNIDAFNNGEGLIVLKPGETWQGSFGVELCLS